MSLRYAATLIEALLVPGILNVCIRLLIYKNFYCIETIFSKYFWKKSNKIAHNGYVRDPTALTVASLVYGVVISRVHLLSCIASSSLYGVIKPQHLRSLGFEWLERLGFKGKNTP